MRRKAFTLIELLVVVAIIALLISILLPSLARARELSKRAVCAANLKGIGTACATYANDNDQVYPVPAGKAATATDGNSLVTFGGKIGYLRFYNNGKNLSDLNSTVLSTTRSFWMLVKDGATAPKQFICPSTDGSPNTDDQPANYLDFGNGDGSNPAPPSPDYYKQISYGIQVPFGQVGKPTTERDTRMVLMADKGWYSATLDGAMTNPQGTNVKCDSNSSPDDWRAFNSPNHGGLGEGEGQNVAYADFHVEFDKRPLSGVALDNIYTRWNTVNGGTNVDANDRVKGTVGPAFAPFGDLDTYIYP
jgi:prepilin-type N-terminal cleavage/methylation domain-containing protein